MENYYLNNEDKKKIKKKNKSFVHNILNANIYKTLFILNNIIILILFFISKPINKLNTNSKLLLKEIKNKENKKLFIRNKTEYYFQTRKRFLKNLNIDYNESKLITFQDKLSYLVIHESPEYKSNIVDKIKLHEYSKKVLGKDICVPIIKIYENINQVKFDELPNKFVLKFNHGSGMNIICKNKSTLNINEVKIKLNDWKKMNFGLIQAEFQYLYVKKKLFVSPYLCDNIIDYEIYCFNGKPKFIRVQKLLNEENHTLLHNYYDLNWKLNDIESGLKGYFRIPEMIIERPKKLDLMLYYSQKLSNEFAFVRIDLYEVNNTVYLSEMTFTPSNALMTLKNEEQSIYLGKFLDISKIAPYLYNQ